MEKKKTIKTLLLCYLMHQPGSTLVAIAFLVSTNNLVLGYPKN